MVLIPGGGVLDAADRIQIPRCENPKHRNRVAPYFCQGRRIPLGSLTLVWLCCRHRPSFLSASTLTRTDWGAELDETRIYYGRADERCAKKNGKPAATKATQAAAVLLARRVGCVASESGEASLKGGNELIEDAVSGRVGLDARPEAARPLCANRPPRSG